MSLEELWPPQVGEPLPRAGETFGVRRKLAKYSLDLAHEIGGPKALGFKRILGITLEHIDYLEGAIHTGVLLVPVSSVRENRPYGIKCMVMVPVRGLGKKSGRIVNVRTIWELLDSDTPPRLANAYLRP